MIRSLPTTTPQTTERQVGRYLAALLCATFLLAACGPPEDTRPGQPVRHRQEAFKALLRALEPMGVMVKQGPYQPAVFLAQAQALKAAVDGPWPYFLPDSNYPPSKSKDAVWSDPAGFDRARAQFVATVHTVLEAAQSNDEARARQAYQAVEDSCAACHRHYRK